MLQVDFFFSFLIPRVPDISDGKGEDHVECTHMLRLAGTSRAGLEIGR